MTTPPRAAQHPTSFTRHGVTIEDEYAWLRADNWQQVMREPETLDAGIRAYLEAENTYLKETLADTDDLQARLFEEMKARIKEDDSSVPSPDGPWSYYTSFVTGGQYPLFCRCPRGGDSGGADASRVDSVCRAGVQQHRADIRSRTVPHKARTALETLLQTDPRLRSCREFALRMLRQRDHWARDSSRK